ncbi:Jacalin-related lectin 3 [Linum perenne]
MNFDYSERKPISDGPWGGQGGYQWDDGVYYGVRQLVIGHGAAIDSLQFEYDKKGASIWSERHGGSAGNNTDKVKLDYPNEVLTSIHGHYGSLHEFGPVIVRSLTFQTNKTSYGPFGDEHGTYFSFLINGRKIVGIHGRSGWYVDAIGIHLKPVTKLKALSKALVQTTANSYVTRTSEKHVGYSVIQGSGGGNDSYDVVVAVRQKSDSSSGYTTPPQSKVSPPKKTHLSLESNKGSGSSKTEGVLKYGPWGGQGGNVFDDGSYTGIRQIHLSRNVGIVYLRAQYDRNGQPIWSSRHGGTGGFKTHKIMFDYPQEVLTHIIGTYGPLMYMGPNIIKSLTFYTNKGKHGPFGDEHGPSFFSKMNQGRIVGFHGREGFFLDGIGVHVLEGNVNPPKNMFSDAIVKAGAVSDHHNNVAEIDNSPWSNKLVVANRGQATEEVDFGVMKEPIPEGPGPWGGEGGRPWDDGVFSGIKQMFLTRTPDAICSIQIEYDRGGQSVWSVKHGCNTGTYTHRVKLEYPHEVLVSVSGYYGTTSREDTQKVVKAMSFQTSRGKYGPFGEEVGMFFTSSTAEGKVVGFHGRSGAYLDAIGVHMQYWLGSNRASKQSIFKRFS